MHNRLQPLPNDKNAENKYVKELETFLTDNENKEVYVTKATLDDTSISMLLVKLATAYMMNKEDKLQGNQEIAEIYLWGSLTLYASFIGMVTKKDPIVTFKKLYRAITEIIDKEIGNVI